MKIKVCGLTRPQDALEAERLGAWALGFIFYPQSARFIQPSGAAPLIAQLRTRVNTVGVFVNASFGEVVEAVKVSGVKMVQLHGDESPDDARRIHERLRLPVIKAFRLKDENTLSLIKNFDGIGAHILVDAAAGEAYGGTGQLADLALARRAAAERSVILAGGLTPENVAAGIVEVRPFAVDVSSGLEASPGIKDFKKMGAFFARASSWEKKHEI